jgi:DNA-binding transcriptional MerR regulator
VYDEDDVDWLGVCIRLRASGMPLTDIRRYTELIRAGQGNELERLEVLREHRERVLAQMHELNDPGPAAPETGCFLFFPAMVWVFVIAGQ